MAKHKVMVTLTGHFEIDDKDLSAYDARNVHEAVGNQLDWLEDNGDIMEFVSGTIQDAVLVLDVVTEL